MRFIIYFLIFVYFSSNYDSFFIGLIAAIGAAYGWRYLKNRMQASEPTAGARSWGENTWGKQSTRGGTSYDFGRGHIRSAIFPNEVFTPISFYVAALFLCLGRIAKAKGVVHERDIDLANRVMNQLRLPEALRSEARKYFNQGKGSNFSVSDLVLEVKKQFIAFPNFQRMFFDICLSAAILDGRIIASEKSIIRDLFPLTGARPELFDDFIGQFEQGAAFGQERAHTGYGDHGQSQGRSSQDQGWGRATKSKLAEALATLGVTEDVQQDELKRVYRRLINQYHPDKLAGQNLPEGLVEMAKEKTQQIISSYNYIMEYKGWSR